MTEAQSVDMDIEDDAISVNSTVDSEHSEDHEYIVVRILAERKRNGREEFLLLWEGYPEHRASWEPEAHIIDDGILETWEVRKLQEAKGEVTPYDLGRLNAIKENRKRLRREKRRRLGYSASSPRKVQSRPVISDHSSDEAEEVYEVPGDSSGMQAMKSSYSSTTERFRRGNVQPREDLTSSDIDSRGDMGSGHPPYRGTARPKPRSPEKSKHIRSASDSSSGTLLAFKRARPVQNPANINPANKSRPSPQIAKPLSKDSSSRDNHSSNTSASTRGRARGATRGGSSLLKKRTLIGASSDPKNAPKLFNNMRQRRKAELQARGLSDIAPDLDALGGLYKPDTYKRVKPLDVREPTNINQENHADEGLFVSDDETQDSIIDAAPKKATDGAFVVPPYQAPSQGPPPNPKYAVCYFWNRAQVNPEQPPCSNGYLCTFLHEYQRGVPVAPPPVGLVEHDGEIMEESGASTLEPPQTCFFWDRGQRFPNTGCIKTHCGYLHSYEGALSVRSPPPGWKELDSPLGDITKDQDLDNVFEGRHREEQDNAKNLQSTQTRPLWQVADKPTCYYWDRGNKQPEFGSCSRSASTCRFLHAYVEGLRIARPPGGMDELLDDVPAYTTEPISYNDNYRPPTYPRTPELEVSTRKNSIPEQMTCHFWNLNLTTKGFGDCTRGGGCKFLHYTAPDIPIAPPPGSNLDRYVPDVDKSEAHSGSKSLPIQSQPSIRPSYVPSNPFNAICYDWINAGVCSKRDACNYIHSNMEGVPYAPKPTRSNSITEPARQDSTRDMGPYNATCYFWARDNRCHKSGGRCKYLHYFSDKIPIAPGPLQGPDRKQETCRYWSKGYCEKSEEDCPYRHGHLLQSSDTLTEQLGNDTTEDARYKTAHGICYDFSTGDCKWGHACKYKHELTPSELRDGSNPSDSKLPRWEKREIAQYKADHNICFNFSNGNCKWGQFCRHKHELIPGEFAKQTEFGRRESLGNSSVENIRSNSDIEMAYQAEITPAPASSLPEDQSFAPPPNQLDDINPRPDQHQDILTSSVNSAMEPSNRMAKPRTKMSIDEYRQKSQRASITREKQLFFGNGAPLIADLGDFSQMQELDWAQQLSIVPKFKFDRVCLAQDFAKQDTVLRSSILWRDNVVVVNPTDTTLQIIDALMEELELRMSGVICCFSEFNILIHPRTDKWRFLEKASNINISESAKLSYLIFRYKLEGSKSVDLKKDIGLPTANKPVPAEKALAQKILGLRLKDMLPSDIKPTKSVVFFLAFPPSALTLSNFLVSWIYASHERAKISTSQHSGSWDNFVKVCKDPEVYAFVLIYESLAPELYRFPQLQNLTNNGKIGFYCIADSGSPNRMYPSGKSAVESSKPGQIITTRLLPQGQVFLLMPSFIVAEPKRAYELLEWFFGKNSGQTNAGKFGQSIRGTWKLVMCGRVGSWLLNLAIAKSNEKDEFSLAHKNDPGLEEELLAKGLDHATCKVRFAIHSRMVDLEYKGLLTLLDPDDRYPDPLREERYEPTTFAPHDIQPDDEQALLHWFAFWTLQRLDLYRKFTVVGTGPRSSKKAQRIKSIYQAPSETSDTLESLRVNTLGLEPLDMYEPLSELAHNIADANKSNATSRCTPVGRSTNSDLHSFHDPMDVEAQILELIESGKQQIQATGTTNLPAIHAQYEIGESGGSKTASPMELDSSPVNKENPTSGRPTGPDAKQAAASEMIYFEPTTEWYGKLKDEGKGYEHLNVASWDKAFFTLGIAK